MAEVISRRERIVREIRRRMDDIQQGQPVDDPYQVTFGVITRGSEIDLGLSQEWAWGLSIIDTDETKTPKIQQMVCQLTIVLEFAAWVDEGQEPSSVGNQTMLAIQRKMREDIHLTEPNDGRSVSDRELSENVVEIRNQMFIDGYADRRITGAVFYQVQYKHSIQDPRLLVSSIV